MWNKDEIEGEGKKAKGKIKDKAGEWSGNRQLEAEGEAEQVEGEVQKGFGKVRRKAGEVIEKTGKKIAR